MKPLLIQCGAVVVLCGLLVCGPVQAQELRLGFVKTDRIFKEATIAKTASAKIDQEFSARDKDLVDQSVSLKSLVDRFQIETPTMSGAQSTTRQKSLADQERELQRKRRAFQEDLAARKNEELQRVLARADEVVKQVAAAEKYDLVLQEAVYVNPRIDLTNKVLDILNAQPVK